MFFRDVIKEVRYKMIIRNATMADLDAIAEIEKLCFPETEAASREAFFKRLETFANHFWVLEEAGKVVSVINGMVSDIPMLVDEMYEDAVMHCENGAWQMIFGVITHPDYQKKGYASMIMKRVMEEAVKQGRKGIVLTCKEHMIPFYKKFGFINEGKSKSKHGGETWYDMRLMITDEFDKKN